MAAQAPLPAERVRFRARPHSRALSGAVQPGKQLVRILDRLARRVDRAPMTHTTAAARLRRGVAVLVAGYAVVYEVQSAVHGSLVSPVGLIMLMIAFALYVNRGGRFLRDWVPVIVGLIAYVATVSAVPSLNLDVHYRPQIDADRVIGFGAVPTNWLQDHLYDGHTGPLEIFSLAMYLSHFLAPLVLGFLLWAVWTRRAFSDLLFGLLAVSILADITFLLAPTAPPWLAADHGLIPQVDPIIKTSLYDLHLNALAARKGDASSYNIVAAIPSLHVAWPVLCLLVIRKHRLPRWLFAGQLALTLGVVFAIVYTGEHYVADAFVGAVYAVVASWLVQVVVGARRTVQAAPATGS